MRKYKRNRLLSGPPVLHPWDPLVTVSPEFLNENQSGVALLNDLFNLPEKVIAPTEVIKHEQH